MSGRCNQSVLCQVIPYGISLPSIVDTFSRRRYRGHGGGRLGSKRHQRSSSLEFTVKMERDEAFLRRYPTSIIFKKISYFSSPFALLAVRRKSTRFGLSSSFLQHHLIIHTSNYACLYCTVLAFLGSLPLILGYRNFIYHSSRNICGQ